jgi:zinc transport system ATP-binding protein
VHGATVIMISHEMNMVYNYATQVICLNKSLVCMGVPDVAITKDVMAKLYGNEMAAKPHRHK